MFPQLLGCVPVLYDSVFRHGIADFEAGEGVMDCVVAEDETATGGDAVVGVEEGFGGIFSCEAGADAGITGVEDYC